ncbi:hypothetical protein DENIS_0889 [Desulfonema ishimotonii]|uniref:Uncharacterized protein n=1 Tax=Desulfonema ishimotonii TaxID=45657 RepID=A0A401FSK7_9BACT|nr:hypothetical protein [Desulfonema ishimotonii]GBC59947.1 hypothetical protein DENIS_0889 [Desulfonema ishimotonii]
MKEQKKIFTGALMTDCFNYPSPFITLVISKESLIIKIFDGIKYNFLPSNILNLKELKNGIQIIHNINRYPSFIFFRYDAPKDISSAINSIGVFGKVKVSSISGSEYEQYNYLRIAGCFIVGSIILIGLILTILTAK